jgi:serine/threonine protein kinase
MDYLYSKKCIHRDLAARNAMVAHDTLQPTFLIAKISDFGLSKQISKNNTDDDTYYYRGNPDEFPVQWYAPDGLQQALFTFGSDVWSFGVTLWEIFSFGQKPNYKQNGENLNLVAIFKFLEDGKRLERVRPIPKEVYDVMLECWNFDHSKRPTFRELFHKISRLDSTNFN